MKPYSRKAIFAAALALVPTISTAEKCYFEVQAEYYSDAQKYSQNFLRDIIGQNVRAEDLPGGTVHITTDCRKLESGLTEYRRYMRPKYEDLQEEIYQSIRTDRAEGYLTCARRASNNYDIVIQQMDEMLEIAATAFRYYQKKCDGNLLFDWEDLS
ncbi:MAG: hypothetical protein RIC49_12085 [Phycisphaerales bacterium]